MNIADFSDHIHIVEEVEAAKYVEPKGALAKTWDWISEYHSNSFKILTYVLMRHLSV
jgi:hypothetical protein